MATETLLVAGLILGMVVIDAVCFGALLRAERRVALAELERLERLHAGERDRLAKRVEYLEFQLASHLAHVLKLPPPAPPLPETPVLKPLPEVMQKFLDAMDDAEARAEFEADFRTRLAYPNADPAGIVAEALNAAP